MTDQTEDQTQENQSSAPDPVDRVVRIGQLMDFYGGLLTERQRTFVKLHFEDDLSFGEIARQHGISRQAIHDAVKHAEQSLTDYEQKLGLMRRGIAAPVGDSAPAAGQSASEAPAAAPSTVGEPDRLEAAVKSLREVHDRLRRSGGIIYNAEGVTREIGQVAEELERLLADSR